jgi:MoaA/NifB/PqqE/SkfB family radical SAM enzyme
LFKYLRGLFQRACGRHLGELLKFLEIELLGRHASTYCYHHPSHALIELTTRCNLRCQWCNQSDPEWQKAHGHIDMPFDRFETIVAQLAGSRVLLLYNIGEPLLYKRLYDAIQVGRRYIPEVRITTNAMLLDEAAARNLESAGLTQLNISIDSPDAEIMERIRPGSDLAKIEANIQRFGEVCTIPVHIWCVISDANAESLANLPEWAARFPVVRNLYFQLQNGVATGEALGLPPLRSEDAFRRLQTVVARRCSELRLSTNIESLPWYPEGFHQRQAKGICKAPFTQLVAVNVEGKLAPCCSFATHSLGDVVELGFKAVWNGAAMRAWRKDMLDQRYCAYCSEWCGYRQNNGRQSLPIRMHGT